VGILGLKSKVESGSGSRKTIIALIALVVLLAGALIYFLATNRTSAPAPTSNTSTSTQGDTSESDSPTEKIAREYTQKGIERPGFENFKITEVKDLPIEAIESDYSIFDKNGQSAWQEAIELAKQPGVQVVMVRAKEDRAKYGSTSYLFIKDSEVINTFFTN